MPDRAPEPAAVASALVVDGDHVSCRFVELALGRDGGFLVESAGSGEAALDVLKNQLIDLVVADTDLPDMNGLRFFRRLAQESRLRSIPFVFLSTDKRPETRVAALRAGVADYLIKPVHTAELLARAQSLVERERRLREERRRAFTLAGDFSAMAFSDLVGSIEMARRSGALSIVTASCVGQLFFERGRVVHAVYGNLAGPEAFYRFLGEDSGQFEFAPGACDLPPELWSIRDSVTALVLEGARLLDSGQVPSVRPPAPRPPASGTFVAVSQLRRRLSALAPDATLAAQLVAGITDPFVLAELQLWNARDLERWTSREVGVQRLHVVLVADLAAGVSAMLPLAAAPTERWVLGGLEDQRKALGLSFFLRHERTVDLVLVDARAPERFAASLARVPALLVVAPPGGDFIGMGTKERVALEQLGEELPAPAVLLIGNAALRPTSPGAAALARRARRVDCVAGALGDGACDLRSLLGRGIRLWAAGAEAAS